MIRVEAAAVNPIGWKYRRGPIERELHVVLGEDVSGTAEVSRTDGFAPGDAVLGVTTSGGYAEYATASARGDVADAVSGVDLALDTVGGATTAFLLPALPEGGTLVTIAYPPEKPPQDCRCWVKPLIMRPSAEQLGRIAELAASGVVRVEIAEEFELADIQRAHALSESGHTRGKTVLTVGSAL